jgi:hypothetical protein
MTNPNSPDEPSQPQALHSQHFGDDFDLALQRLNSEFAVDQVGVQDVLLEMIVAERATLHVLAQTGVELSYAERILSELGDESMISEVIDHIDFEQHTQIEQRNPVVDKTLLAVLRYAELIALGVYEIDNPARLPCDKKRIQSDIFTDQIFDADENTRDKLIAAADILMGGEPFQPDGPDITLIFEQVEQRIRNERKMKIAQEIYLVCESVIDMHGFSHDDSREISHAIAIFMSNQLFPLPDEEHMQIMNQRFFNSVPTMRTILGWSETQFSVVFNQVHQIVVGTNE